MTKSRQMIGGKRYDLSHYIDLDYSQPERHGVTVKAVYYGKHSHRLLWHRHSIWDDGFGGIVGDSWHVTEPTDATYGHEIQLLLVAGCPIPEDVPVEEIAD